MRLRDGRLAVIAVALVIAGATVWSMHRFQRYQPFANLAGGTQPGGLARISLLIQDATVTGREDGLRRWQLSCDAITFSRDRREVAVDGIRNGLLYDKRGTKLVSVTASHARYSTPYGDLIASQAPIGGTLKLFGGIQATTLGTSRFHLTSDRLNWDPQNGVAECPGRVDASAKGTHATAQLVTINARTGDLEMRDLHGDFLISTALQRTMAGKTASRQFLALAGALLFASGAPGAAKAPEYVTYDAGYSRWLNAPHTVEMSKGVTFQQGDSTLKTDAAIVTLDDQQRALSAKSQSPVHLYNPQDDLTGQQGFIDFTRHLATLSGDVKLIAKPGPDDKNAPPGSIRSIFKDAATLTCAKMTYDYRRKIGHVPGPLTVTQKDRVLTADSGKYDATSKTVTLTGNVHGRNGEDEITAPTVIIGLQEGAESITIPVPFHGRMRVKDDDADSSNSAESPPPKSPPTPVQPPTVKP